MERATVHLNPADMKKLREIAVKRGLLPGQVLREIVLEWLENQPDKKPAVAG